MGTVGECEGVKRGVLDRKWKRRTERKEMWGALAGQRDKEIEWRWVVGKGSKVSLQTSLERNPTNSSYIFILNVNFENLTVKLHVFITSLILAKFQENQRSIIMLSNKCYNFKFL